MVWPMIFCTIWASRPKKGHPRTGIYCYFMFFWHGVYPNVWFFSVYVYQTIHLGLSISLSHSHKELQSPRLNPCCFLPRTSLVSSDHSGVFLGSSDSGYWAENFGGFIMFDKHDFDLQLNATVSFLLTALFLSMQPRYSISSMSLPYVYLQLFSKILP